MSRREIEPAGILYDRYRIHRLAEQLVAEHGVRSVLEIPAGGAKAMPSIYSLAFGSLGCEVHLFDPDDRGLAVWDRLGLRDRLTVHEGSDPTSTSLPDASFDLVWNFVTAGTTGRLSESLREMARLSRRLVLTVHCSGWNWGYPWHRALHLAFGLPWNHGPAEAYFPHRVRALHRAVGLTVLRTGTLDMPFWPDPPGFRDVRLHRAGVDPHASDPAIEWESPVETFYRSGELPPTLRWLGRIENLPWPRPVRFVFSHLFYVLGTR